MTKEDVKRVLLETYGAELSSAAVERCAGKLYSAVFERECALQEIFPIVYATEWEELEDKEGLGKEWYVFSGVIELLEDGPKTAERLYECFCGFADFGVLQKLMRDNIEWLTEERARTVKRIALGTFDREILRSAFPEWEVDRK